MKKCITIDQLKPGMYVTSLDKSWLCTPFLFHKRKIRHEGDIALLKQYGIRKVTIDPTQGCDVTEALPALPLVSHSDDDNGRKDTSYSQEPPSPSQDLCTIEQHKCETDLQSLEQFSHKTDLTAFARRHQVPVTAHTPREEVIHLCLNMIHDIPQSFVHVRALSDELLVARTVRTEATVAVESLFEGVRTGARIDSSAVKQVVSNLLDSLLRSPEASLMLVQLRQFDTSLFTHAVDTCVLALTVGKEQGINTEHLSLLGMGALLHDIGKMRLPRNLQRHTHNYSAQERLLLRQHPDLGAAILSQCAQIPAEACQLVAEHHERNDGSGYPKGLSGTCLSPLGQIVGITNTYTALLNGHGSHPPLPPTQALRQLYQLGRTGAFHVTLLEQMIRAVGVYPVGTLVELNTKERGLVLTVNPTDMLKPVVKILSDCRDTLLTVPLVVDLATPAAGEPQRMIVCALDPVLANINLADYVE